MTGYRNKEWWDWFRSTLSERFWKRVDKTTGCWLWLGQVKKDGLRYGLLKIKYKHAYAHRVAWELVNGSIPEGLEVLHHCDVPHCVRPTHLFLGTQEDNMHDMAAKGRARNGHTKAAFA